MPRGTKNSYIDPDVSEAKPELSEQELIDFYGLTDEEVGLLDGCVERVRDYTKHAGKVKGQGGTYEGETAGQYLNRMMPDATTARRVHVLQAAIAKGKEDGVDLRTRREATWYDKIPTEDLLDEIRTLALDLGHTPRQRDVRELGDYSLKAYRSRFGSWADACEAAGLVPNEQGVGELQSLPDGLREEAA